MPVDSLTPGPSQPPRAQQAKKPRRVPKPGLLAAAHSKAAAAAAAGEADSHPTAADGLRSLPMRCNLPRVGPSLILPDRLYLGGIGDAMNRKMLTSLNVRVIYNMTREFDNMYLNYFSYLKIPFDDDIRETLLSTHLLHAIVDRMFQNIFIEGQNIFVHCAAGISRSVTIVVAYLIKYGRQHEEIKLDEEEVDPSPTVDSSSSPSTLASQQADDQPSPTPSPPSASSSPSPSPSPSPSLPPRSPPTYDSVLRFVQSRRPIARPNERFERILRQFREELVHKNESSNQKHHVIDDAETKRIQDLMQIHTLTTTPKKSKRSTNVKPLPGKLAPSVTATATTNVPSSTPAVSSVPRPVRPTPAPAPAVVSHTRAARFTRLCEEQAAEWMTNGTLTPSNEFTLHTDLPQQSELVSIIMPVHNAAPFLPATLMSLLHQTWRPLELCAYDDFSHDNSLDVLEQFRSLFERYNIRMKISSAHTTGLTSASGAGFARNRAIELASGTYYGFQDSDDISMPERIERQFKEWNRTAEAAAEEDANESSSTTTVALTDAQSLVDPPTAPTSSLSPLILVGCHLERLPSDATPRWTRWINGMSRQQLFHHAFREITLPCPTWFTHSSTFKRVGMFQELLGEDMHFFYSSLLTNGCRLTSLMEHEPMLIYRNHASNLSGRTPFSYLFGLRVAALEKLILTSGRYSNWNGTFSIWNAGKAGKHFYRALTPATQQRVTSFCDIDPKKIERGVFEAHIQGSRTSGRKIPIISWTQATAPIIICVRQELEEDEAQREFRHRIEVIKGWVEGVDYFYLS